MGSKHTGELWVYVGTPMPNPSGNTGVMVCFPLPRSVTSKINLERTYVVMAQWLRHPPLMHKVAVFETGKYQCDVNVLK